MDFLWTNSPLKGGSVDEWLACWTQAQKSGFKSQPQRCRVTVLGKLFTAIVPLFAKQRNWYQPPYGLRGLLRAWRKVMAAYVGFMTHVNCRLTVKNRDQLRNPTLGSRVWATFTFI